MPIEHSPLQAAITSLHGLIREDQAMNADRSRRPGWLRRAAVVGDVRLAGDVRLVGMAESLCNRYAIRTLVTVPAGRSEAMAGGVDGLVHRRAAGACPQVRAWPPVGGVSASSRSLALAATMESGRAWVLGCPAC